MKEPRWSGHQLRRLGDRLRDDVDTVDDSLTYDDVRNYYARVALSVQERIAGLDWRPLLGHRSFEVTARAKTIDTLKDKLRRDRSTPLSRIQDIAGVRFEAEMSLAQQQTVAEALARAYEQDASWALRDLRAAPHSGYRAVHVWLRLPVRVEVQVRTHLQGAWANLYEEAGDHFGRAIRYGVRPADPVEAEVVDGLQRLSEIGIAELELRRNALNMREIELDDELRLRSKRLIQVSREGSEGLTRRALEAQFQRLREREETMIQELNDLRDQLRTMSRAEGGFA